MKPRERWSPMPMACGTWLIALLLGGIASCRSARRADMQDGASAETAPAPVSVPVLAWLSKARALHHAADLAEDQGDPERATEWLDELVRGARPPVQAPEIDDVMADTFARMAELRSRRDAFDQALADVARGLESAREASYFRGHLFEVAGLVHERRTQKLSREGKPDEAARARDEAIRASLEAVRIQNDVLARALGDAAAHRDGGTGLERDPR